MLQRRVLVLMLVSLTVQLTLASASATHLNHLSSDISASTSHMYDQQQDETWQPMVPAQSNWIILQTTTTNARAPHTQTMAQTQRTQRHPVNYYAYNHSQNSAGNYRTSALTTATEEANIVEPYVLAISKIRRNSDGGGGDVTLSRRKLPAPLVTGRFSGENKLLADTVANTDFTTKPLIDVTQNVHGSRLSVGNKSSITSSEVNDDTLDAEKQFHEMLLPLENALDKAIRFCDIIKRVISDEGEEAEHSNDLDSSATPMSAEVQGHNDASALSLAKSSSTAFALTSLGTGRKVKKIKKKLKKFVLPLLIAYKLKFLTLVPVLIGGLTLLVGATGLAGFFFALFAAVMSLKTGSGSGGKSIVITKY